MCKFPNYCKCSYSIDWQHFLTLFYSRETIERVNVKFNDNGTMTYQDKKTYTFSEELSAGSEWDSVTVPNMPFLVR